METEIEIERYGHIFVRVSACVCACVCMCVYVCPFNEIPRGLYVQARGRIQFVYLRAALSQRLWVRVYLYKCASGLEVTTSITI